MAFEVLDTLKCHPQEKPRPVRRLYPEEVIQGQLQSGLRIEFCYSTMHDPRWFPDEFKT